MTAESSTSEHLLPHFFILGERKCGTSSLYRYLLDHPLVLPSPRKEMQFFTRGAAAVAQGFSDYLRAFPRVKSSESETLLWPELDSEGMLHEELVNVVRHAGRAYVTGEASADTFSEVDPALLRRYLPALRLIVILRDPTERAFSHHRMLGRFQAEGRKLDQVIGDFAEDMRRELAEHQQGLNTTFLAPGLYLRNLLRWAAEWGDARPLVLFCEDLEDPKRGADLMQRVLAHLALHNFDYSTSLQQRYNQAPPQPVPPNIAAELRSFYRPHNQALQAELSVQLPW